MATGILIAVLAGLGGMLGWGLADFFAKKTIDEIGDIQSLALGHFFGTLALLIVFAYQATQVGMASLMPATGGQWFGLAFFGVLQAIVYLFVYNGFGKGSVSLLSPVFASFSGITALLSILVYKEVVSSYVLFGLAVIFIGIMVLNSDRETFRLSKKIFSILPGFKEVAVATVLAAIWTLYWDRFVGGENWLTYTFFMYTFMTLAIFLYAAMRKIKLVVHDTKIWKFLVLIGVTEVVAYAALSWGYSVTTHTSIIALISGAFSLPVIVLAAIFLKERMTKIQFVGTVVTIIGIMLISLFNF